LQAGSAAMYHCILQEIFCTLFIGRRTKRKSKDFIVIRWWWGKYLPVFYTFFYSSPTFTTVESCKPVLMWSEKVHTSPGKVWVIKKGVKI
jgi:hypothetical protein